MLATYGISRKVPTLTVAEFTTFTDGSHRSNYTVTDEFTKGKPMRVTKAGTSAANYPLGDSVTPSASGTFLAPYTFSFARALLDGTVNAAGTRLTVKTWTEFTDHSGRSNYETAETLIPLR